MSRSASSSDCEGDNRPLLWPIHEAARFLSISKYTLYYWAAARRIPHYRIGRKVMFAKADLVTWLKTQYVEKVA